MNIEIHNEQLINLGFKANQSLIIGEGRIGVNNVVGFTNESKEISFGNLPARFLAGFLPTFLLAETIQKVTNLSPTVRIFFPRHIAEAVNGIGNDELNNRLQFSQMLIEAFKRTCFPTIDLAFKEDEPLTPAASKVLRKFSDFILTSGDREIVERIRASAKKHGDQQGMSNADIYIAHHPFGWQEVESIEIFNEKLPDIVINTVPPSEKRFLALRRSIRERIRQATMWRTPKEIHDLEMNIAGAHYLLQDPREPTIKDALFCPIEGIIQRFKELYKQTDNDNIRKAKNDFEKLISLIAERTRKTREEVNGNTLGELLAITI